MHHNPEEFIGVDFGQVRVGLARGSSLARIAEPLRTVPAEQIMDELSKLLKNQPVSGIVVGLPRGLDGQETAQTKAVKDWVKQMKSHIKLSFYWQDEALTSQLSEQDPKNQDTDAMAAAMLLQDFLNTRAEDRVIA